MAVIDERHRFSSFLLDLRQQLSELKDYIEKLRKDFRNQDTESDKGISLLELKCHLMLNYLSNLSYLALRKLTRKSIKGDEAIFRLAETRTVLERIRPIEQKLQYQIDKLLKTASSNVLGRERDALSFKPNPEALMANEEQESGENGDEGEALNEEQKSRSKVYVPPKLMAVPYQDESDMTNKTLEKARRRALSSSLVRELQEQYGQAPEEIMDVDSVSRRNVERQKEHMRYEEDNFVRLQMSKAQKRTAKRVSAKSTLQTLLDFGEYNVDETTEPKKRKRPHVKNKNRSKGKGKGKGKRN